MGRLRGRINRNISVIRFITVLLLTVFATGTFLPFYSTVNAATGDEVRAAKKIVSVVYDDSSSMDGDRWSYANYSMQALIALLNEQDELYITFMTNPSQSQRVDLSSIQESVNSIHDLTEWGATPETALDTAFNTLENINESEPTTQFWYIVMTDGEVTNINAEIIDIQGKLNSYRNHVMSNNTELNVVYLGMSGAAQVVGDQANHLYSFMPENDSDIVSTMQDISNLISNRVEADSINIVDSRTIEVSSDLPLYSISVFSQRSSASVVSASTQEQTLNVLRNISVDATDVVHGSDISSLYGDVAVINYEDSEGQRVVPAGTYTIQFSDDINLSDVSVQFEPAIGFIFQVMRGGAVIDDLSQLNCGDTITVQLVPVVPGTNEEIPSDTLPSGISWHIDYLVEGNEVLSVDDCALTDVAVYEGDSEITGTVTIEGFTPYYTEISFSTVVIVYHFGIEVVQPDDLSYDRSTIRDILFDESNTVTFYITNDGERLSSDELDSLGLSLVIDSVDFEETESDWFFSFLSHKPMNCELTRNDDGSYSLIPVAPYFFRFSKWIFNLSFSFIVKDGLYTANVSLSSDNSITSSGWFKVVHDPAEDGEPIKIPIIILIIIYLLYILLFKKKFRGQTVYFETWNIRSDGSGDQIYKDSVKLRNNPLILLLPLSYSFKKLNRGIRGLVLVADSGGTVYITADSIAKSVEQYGDYVMKNPETDLGRIVEDLKETINEDKTRSAEELQLSDSPIYFVLLTNSGTVYRVWMKK